MAIDRNTLFRILADPTRRQILDLLAEQGPLTVSELAAEFPKLVPSGISKHLMGLRAANLVSASRHGRQQIYHLDPDALTAELKPWLSKYERYWSSKLEQLRELAQENSPEANHVPPKKNSRRR